MSWLNPSTGYVLEQTADMSAAGGGWTDVAQPPVVNGANKEVTLPAAGQLCFSGYAIRESNSVPRFANLRRRPDRK